MRFKLWAEGVGCFARTRRVYMRYRASVNAHSTMYLNRLAVNLSCVRLFLTAEILCSLSCVPSLPSRVCSWTLLQSFRNLEGTDCVDGLGCSHRDELRLQHSIVCNLQHSLIAAVLASSDASPSSHIFVATAAGKAVAVPHC